MSISMPSYFMFNLKNMDERYKQTIWDSLSEEDQKAADTEWKSLNTNGSTYGKNGTTTISSTPSEALFNKDSKQIAASRDTTYSAEPSQAALTGFNSLLSEDTSKGLIFVDLKNANTDAAKASLASDAYNIMSGRFGGSQGLLGVDLNGNGHLDDASELFGSGSATRAGYLDFVVDASKLSAGDRFSFSASRSADGATQDFEVTTETSAAEIAAAINQKVADGELSGVQASVVDGRLRLDPRDDATGEVDLRGTVSGSYTDRTGDVATAAALTPADGTTGGRADFAVDPAKLTAGDRIRFTLGSGTEQSFTIAGETSVDALVAAINKAVEDGGLAGVGASNEGGALRLTAIDPNEEMAAATLVDTTPDATKAGTAHLGDGMQDIDDYVSVAGDGTVTWTSEKTAMVLSSSGSSTAANLNVSGLVNGSQAAVTTSLVLGQNQTARIDVTV
jgi:hypothetical protein